MAPITNGRYLFNESPKGYPVPGINTIFDGSQTIDLENVPLDGGFLLRTLALSIDPYMRVRMRDSAYVASFKKGQPLVNYGIAVVIRSENSQVNVGDHLYGIFGFQEYHVRKDLKEYNPMGKLVELRMLKNTEDLPWTVYLGACGMTGQTAYYGWKEYALPQKGDVVFVTTGAGAVGSFVVQLAKRHGLKVIACASTDDKVLFIKELGADVAFNYTKVDISDILRKEGPVNIYWDNVGGKQLDWALEHAATGARFIECGMISEYNVETPLPIMNMFQFIGKQVRMTGFLVVDLDDKYREEFYATIPPMIINKELKYREDITKGLENAGDALLSLLKGSNTGKSLVLL